MVTSKTLPYYAGRILAALHSRLTEWPNARMQLVPVDSHDKAPSDLAGLQACAKGGFLPISTADCETAIYGVNGNVQFRFWHDLGHLKHELDMTLEDELILFQRQWVELLPLIPEEDRWYCNLIYQADTAGQAWFNEYTKQSGNDNFPADQTAFVLSIVGIMQPPTSTINVKDAVHRYVYGAP